MPNHEEIIEAQSKEIEALRAALEPFALVAEHDIGESEDDKDAFQPMSRRVARAPGLSVGDLRRARTALKGA